MARKHAAFGIQMHSGWGVLVTVATAASGIEVVDRRRLVTAAPHDAGGNQPYHYASHLELPAAEEYLAQCAVATSRFAAASLSAVIKQLVERDYRLVGCAILLASGRPLPALNKILVAHPLLHSAEGEFFRHTVQQACHDLKIKTTAIRAKELEAHAQTAFGERAEQLQRTIAGVGHLIGPPWTRDHKDAALAAALVLT